MLCAVGINHNRAPLEIREKLTWAGAAAEDALQAIYQLPGVSEAVLLSTCGRTEFYLNAEPSFNMETLATAIASISGVPGNALISALNFIKGREAAMHLFRVTAGLDSIIVGENQIQAQVKSALNLALAAKTSGPLLTQLFSQALRTGKKARTSTGINKGAASIAQAAIDIACNFFGSLQGKSVLLIGAGKTGALAIAHLKNKGASVIIANRTPSHAEELAKSCGGQTASLEDIPQYADKSSLIICSAFNAPGQYILTPQHFTNNSSSRLIIDLSLPRCASPELRSVQGITLIDLDDLRHIVSRNLDKRSDEKSACEAIIASDCNKFIENMLSRNAKPAIISLKARAEEKRQAELKRFSKGATDKEKALLEKFSAALVNSLLHDSLTNLRRLASLGASAEDLLKVSADNSCSSDDLPGSDNLI
ncbi:MAG: glutamyl-tRNA reductase [bacterium]|nr:glutamyl-tRNA reductase [bacterium]